MAVNVRHYLMQAVSAVPAVLLGCLLNILDGVSCQSFLVLSAECVISASDRVRHPFLFRIFFLLFYPEACAHHLIG